MYVKDNMIKNPYTVSLEQSVSQVLDIMAASKVHRLPVVDKSGKLLGLITESIIAKAKPSSSSSLSVYEINYLLNKLSIKDIMVKDVITIGPDALLEEAATIMRKNDIGCLPVIDDQNCVIGIITHNDIFDAFVDLLGYHKNGSRYVINIAKDEAGIFEDICKIFKENGISITNCAVYHTSRGIEIVVIATGKGNISDKLVEHGYNVTSYMSLNN